MKLLLRNVRVIDLESKYHGKVVSLLIEEGYLTKISLDRILLSADEIIDLNGNWITPGWVDLSAFIGDPGYENKEDILSALNSAKQGGFTKICMQPSTNPVLDTKGSIEYVLSKSKNEVVDILPLAAVSAGLKGETITEMLDLNQAGAKAFSEGGSPISNTELLLRALQYSQLFDGVIYNRPADIYLTRYGQMHEGITSTKLGMKGMPALAEELMIKRDLAILEYTGGNLHIQAISSAVSVELIKKAKDAGLKVTCDVPISNLVFTEEQLLTFDTNYKVNPPLRTEIDRLALIEGLKSGVIDAIISDHQPQDIENKNLEFDLAAFGMVQLQTMFSSVLMLNDQLPFEIAVKALSNGARKIMKQHQVAINEGSIADFSIFNPSYTWELNSKTSTSKSHNSPFFGREIVGKCVGMINGNKYFFEQ